MSRRLAAAPLRLLGMLALAAGALIALAVPAAAHATVVYTDPVDGAQLAAAPGTASVAFDESVSVGSGYLRVADASGARVDAGSPSHPGGNGSRLQVALEPGLPDGAYLMSWRVVSADSHVVSGSIRFQIGDGAAGAGGAGSGEQNAAGPRAGDRRAISVLAIAGRAALFAGLALLGGLWVLWIGPITTPAARLARRIAWSGLAAAAGGILVGLLAQGAESSGRGLGSLLDGGQLRDTATSGYGQLSLWALAAVAGIGLLLPRTLRAAAEQHPHGAPEAAAVLLLGAIAAVAATGHAASDPSFPIDLAVAAAHLVAVAAWLGGLVYLSVVLLRGADPRDSRAAAARFAPVAAAAVIVLALTGTYQAWRQTSAAAGVVDTTYGRLVLAKAGLLALIVLIAVAVRRWALGRAPAPRRWLAAEVALGAVALLAAATLVGEPPASAAYAQQLAAKPTTVAADLGQGRRAVLTLDPARHGLLDADVRIEGMGATAVTLTATLDALELGPLDIALSPDPAAPGDWRAERATLPAAGRWTFALTVASGQFDAVTAQLSASVY